MPIGTYPGLSENRLTVVPGELHRWHSSPGFFSHIRMRKMRKVGGLKGRSMPCENRSSIHLYQIGVQMQEATIILKVNMQYSHGTKSIFWILGVFVRIFIQHLSHFSCQPLHCKRFLDVIYSFFQNSMMNNSVIGIA